MSMGGKYVVRRDLGSRGGGVLIMIDALVLCVQVDVPDSSLEMLCIDVHLLHSTVRIVLTYLPGTEGYAGDAHRMLQTVSALEQLLRSTVWLTVLLFNLC